MLRKLNSRVIDGCIRFQICSQIPQKSNTLVDTVYNGYSDNGYSDILDIVILLSLSIFPHLHIHHTKFIGYSDNLA